MSERRYGGWDYSTSEDAAPPDNYPTEQEEIVYHDRHYKPVTEISPHHSKRNRKIERNTRDNWRDFFYWFISNGGFRMITRLISIIVIIALISWVVINRDALLSSFFGFLSEILPIVLVIWIMWTLIRSLINPK